MMMKMMKKAVPKTASVGCGQKIRLELCMVFTQKFEFCFQIFIPLVLGNLIFEASEAPLSSILKN